MREIHHLCLLLGYGANAVNPYLAFETITDLVQRQEQEVDQGLTTEMAHANYVKGMRQRRSESDVKNGDFNGPKLYRFTNF